MTPLNKLFEVSYGHSLELNSLVRLDKNNGGVPFVSRKMGDNGISAYVARIPGLPPSPPGLLTCALGGNGVLSTFLQEEEFYSGRDTALLKPLKPMTKQELIFYCYCIVSNRYRFSYGRQANRTLKNIVVPSIAEIPHYVSEASVEQFDGSDAALLSDSTPQLETSKWQNFRYDQIFAVKKGYYNKKPPTCSEPDCIPFVGATEYENGVTSFVSLNDLAVYDKDGSPSGKDSISKKLFPGGCITVSNNGSVGEAFYQASPFTCSHDVNPLYLLDKSVSLTPSIGLFLAAVIRADKYRWGYGRKWRPIRMPMSTIRLPVAESGKPDWLFMDRFIGSLPYSSKISDTI